MTAIIPARGLSPQGTVPSSGLWVVVLAAGGSRRFGRPKLLVRQGPRTLLERSVRLAQSVAGPRCVLVLGAHASRLAAQLRVGPPVMVVNRRWRMGMSTSLAAGLARLPRSARAALVLLADQHALQARDLRSVMAAWAGRPGAIAASEHRGVLGPPVILPRAAFADARRLTGDAGARMLLRSGRHPVVPVPVPAAATDLDEPSDLLRMQGRGRHRRPL